MVQRRSAPGIDFDKNEWHSHSSAAERQGGRNLTHDLSDRGRNPRRQLPASSTRCLTNLIRSIRSWKRSLIAATCRSRMFEYRGHRSRFSDMAATSLSAMDIKTPTVRSYSPLQWRTTQMFSPASTSSALPVRKTDISEAQNKTARAMSSGTPTRPRRLLSMTGERLPAQTGKSVETLILYIACIRAGAICLPLNINYTESSPISWAMPRRCWPSAARRASTSSRGSAAMG